MHGSAFEAYAAMQHLQAAGIDLAKVQHISPAGQEPGISALLQEAAGLIGVALPAAIQVWSLFPGSTVLQEMHGTGAAPVDMCNNDDEHDLPASTQEQSTTFASTTLKTMHGSDAASVDMSELSLVDVVTHVPFAF